jgi:hypothetical protein
MGLDSEGKQRATESLLAADADLSLDPMRARASTVRNATDAAEAVQKIRDLSKCFNPLD